MRIPATLDYRKCMFRRFFMVQNVKLKIHIYIYTEIPRTSFTMSFTKTTSEDFTTIINGVDNRIQIIQHKETGFYNITKMIKLVNKDKKINDWFSNTNTTELIDACLKETGLEYVHYELKKGTPRYFTGVYVHCYLYDHFMIWLDKRYAIKVSITRDTANYIGNNTL